MYRVKDEDRLLSTGEAATLLGCSVAWLERGRCDGYGPRYLKIGRLVRYRLGDLTAFRDANLVTPSRRSA